MVSSGYKLIAGLQVVPISDDDDGVGCIIHLVTLYALSGYQGNCGPPHIHWGLPADPCLGWHSLPQPCSLRETSRGTGNKFIKKLACKQGLISQTFGYFLATGRVLCYGGGYPGTPSICCGKAAESQEDFLSHWTKFQCSTPTESWDQESPDSEVITLHSDLPTLLPSTCFHCFEQKPIWCLFVCSSLASSFSRSDFSFIHVVVLLWYVCWLSSCLFICSSVHLFVLLLVCSLFVFVRPFLDTVVKWLVTRAWKSTILKSGSFCSLFLSSKSASTVWLRNNKHDVASQRKLSPRRRGRVVRALGSIPESLEFESHSQKFEIQGHDL